MRLFLRKTRITTAGRRWEAPPLAIELDVPFTTDSEGQQATVRVFNVAPVSGRLLEIDASISVEAGYEDDLGLVFPGVIEDVRTRWDGLDHVTEVVAGDATDRWLSVRVAKSWKENTKGSEVVRDVVRALGMNLLELNLPSDPVYPGGKTYHAHAKTVLEEIARDADVQLYVDRGGVAMRPKVVRQETAILLTPRTGLVGNPQRKVERGAVDPESDPRGEVWQIETLLNHRLRADRLVRVECRSLVGNFRVTAGQHVSNDSDHVTRIEVVPVG